MKNIIKKWWFWIIVILIIGAIAGGQNKKTETKKDNSPYITKFEWNIDNASTFDLKYNNGDIEKTYYYLLEVENKEGDLQAGEYIVKPVNNDKSTFLLNITDKTYEDLNDLPIEDVMVQENEETIKLEKGQYLYIVKGSTGTNAGKITLEKK